MRKSTCVDDFSYYACAEKNGFHPPGLIKHFEYREKILFSAWFLAASCFVSNHAVTCMVSMLRASVHFLRNLLPTTIQKLMSIALLLYLYFVHFIHSQLPRCQIILCNAKFPVWSRWHSSNYWTYLWLWVVDICGLMHIKTRQFIQKQPMIQSAFHP